MAITVIAACSVADAVAASEDTQFVATGPFTLYADHFEIGQQASLLRLGPSGDYIQATNEKGVIAVSAYPNMAYVDSAGTYRIRKTATSAAARVGYEEV